MSSRYTIGIDLGTTNCALAFVDTQAKPPRSQVLPLPQETASGVWRDLPTLPSFLYLPTELEQAEILGVSARERAAVVPGRVISSAKSWLCQPSADPNAPFLPWGSSEIAADQKRSPIGVSAQYLARLKAIWELAMPSEEARFERQDITITVPASFDEAAQAATLQAARAAGYPEHLRLLEEPQSAFYAYLETSGQEGGAVRALLGQIPALRERPVTVLVCDIGGGTTDFSLFRIQTPEPRQRVPRIDRLAVSDHLLLGGDNIDLALARLAESKLTRKVSPRQWSQLVALARGLKERVLSGEGGAEFHLSLAGSGASLLQAALSMNLVRDEIERTVRDGFFPLVDKNERPRSGQALREWGLPFAFDSAITRHLASFLDGRSVDAVLFNGGTLRPAFLRERLTQQIARWQDDRFPAVLANADMDLAVARGAASYGAVLRRATGKIRGGYPHSVYLELSRENRFEPARLVCLIPRGFEAGDRLRLDQLQFRLLVEEPVQFQLYYANARVEEAGALLRHEESFHALPPLQTKLTLPPGFPIGPDRKLAIRLEVTLSETGLLQLAAVTTGEMPRQRWQLDFNLRPAESDEKSSGAGLGIAPEKLHRALAKIDLFYGKKKVADLHESPKVLKQELELILGSKREDWNIGVLRALWPALAPGITRRVRSEAHEGTWLYLAGLCLRPGYGSDLDRFRIDEVWRIFANGPQFAKVAANNSQWWIFWRRIVGGLDVARQEAVFGRLVGVLRAKPEPHPEMILLAGSLERLPAATKVELGRLLLRRLFDNHTVALDQVLWALGRLANRIPLYAGEFAALDPQAIGDWVERVLEWQAPAKHHANLALFLSQACLNTGDRLRDVDERVRMKVLQRMPDLGASLEQIRRLREIAAYDRGVQAKLFGETLPAGIQLADSSEVAASVATSHKAAR